MESKKINQLATELAPDLSDLTIIGDPTTGISKKITLSQMASLFTGTVEEYATLAAFPLVGVADTIYIALDTNVIYRYDTSLSAYVILSPNIINSLVFSDANGFDGTITLVGSVATLSITTALTLGSVPFIGASGALTQDNSNLFFDDTNNRFGIATASPTTPLDVFGSGIIGRLNGTSTNNAYLGFASNGTNKWSAGNVQSDHRFRIFSEANSAELITILQTGEFGIGISNPTTKFHIDGAATALIANLDANISVAKSISFRSDNSNRINLEVSGTESGSNAGADFFIRRYSDAGSLIDTPLTIIRSTGNATFSGILTTPQVKAATSAGLSINANSGTQVADFGAGGSANITFFGGLSGTSASFSSSATATAFIPSGATVPTNGMYLSAANTLDFATNSTNRISISSAGVTTFSNNVAINGSSLDINPSAGNSNITLRTANVFEGYIQAITGGGILFGTGASATERMRITSGGNVLINGTTVQNSATSRGNLTINGTTSILNLSISDTNAGYLFHGGTDLLLVNAKNGGQLFYTNDTERMRITSGGNVGIGTVGSSDARFTVAGSDATSSNYSVVFNNNTTSMFYIRNDGVIFSGTLTNSPYNLVRSGRVMMVDVNGLVGYQSSTRESKTNISNLEDISFIYKLNPVSFNYRKTNDISNTFTNEFNEDLHFGLIADEVEKVNKELVFYNEKDGIKELAGVEYGKITAVLIKAIQELKAEIDILKAKIV